MFCLNHKQESLVSFRVIFTLTIGLLFPLGATISAATFEQTLDAMGPLRVCPDNGRYFCDPSGQTVFLAGSHTWNNLIDMGDKHPPPEFDFDEYLDFLEAHNLNTVRLWTWEVAKPEDTFDTPLRGVASPLPWPRTGPGLARDGLPSFDLSRHNTEYFDRLRQRVTRARQRGFYVIVMLFEGWSVQFSPGSKTHPFLPENNINDTDFLADVADIHTLKHPEITAIQQRYVEQVVAALTPVDNVLFEIVNEAGGYSTDWQYQMIDFVRHQLETRGKFAPVGMSYQYRNGNNNVLFASKADWISPGGQPGFYRSNPEAADGEKIVIADTDHIAGSSLLDPLWPYKGLLRGLNLLYMDRYRGPASVSSTELHAATPIRANLGIARLLADSLDIADALPNPALASSRYALQADDWLLVLSPGADLLEVDLRRTMGPLSWNGLTPCVLARSVQASSKEVTSRRSGRRSRTVPCSISDALNHQRPPCNRWRRRRGRSPKPV